MSLITKIPGVVFTDTTLPKLYRDPIVTPGTKWLYDALDTYSWPSQAAPTGGGTFVDLSTVGANASIPGSFGFTEGFTKNAAGYIACPASGKVAADAAGYLFILWLKYGQQPTTGYTGIAGCFDTNGLNQYGITINNNAPNGTVVFSAQGVSTTGLTGPAAGSIRQWAMSLRFNGTNYDTYVFQNGVAIGSASRAGPIHQPTVGPRIGHCSTGVFSDLFVGTFYRAMFDDISTLTSQAAINALVADDYSNNVGRFS